MNFWNEEGRVLAFLEKQASHLKGKAPLRVLDVGSGRGRYLELIRAKGWAGTGVEINPTLAEGCRKKGYQVFSPGDAALENQKFDAVLMSHVVEHFSPHDLIAFLKNYLKFLDREGILVVATPLLHPGFFDDFDHVKPYQPVGFLMLLSEEAAQLQFQWSDRFVLDDLWYRRSPIRITHCRARHVRGFWRMPLRISDLAFSLLFGLTLGLFGRTTGWVGVFRKS